MADRELRHHQMIGHEPELKRGIRRGMNFIERCSKHGNRPAALLECLFVSRRVDSRGESADDHYPVLHQSADESFDAFAAGKRCLSRADYRDACRRLQQPAVAAREKVFRRMSPLVFIEAAHDASGIERHDLRRQDSRVFRPHTNEESTTRRRRNYLTPATSLTASAIDSQT